MQGVPNNLSPARFVCFRPTREFFNDMAIRSQSITGGNTWGIFLYIPCMRDLYMCYEHTSKVYQHTRK